MSIQIRKPYDRTRTPIDFTGVQSVTDKSAGNDTDVNHIVARFQRTGIMPEPRGEAQYCDVTGLQKDLTELISDSNKAMAEYNAKLGEIEAEKQKIAQENAENAQKYAELQKKLAEQQAQNNEQNQ